MSLCTGIANVLKESKGAVVWAFSFDPCPDSLCKDDEGRSPSDHKQEVTQDGKAGKDAKAANGADV